ncbi:MAG TPA: M1 family aminopeptidase [Verrucomicrobiae bacterium]|nr:M1 family aminopeptidase [Verrucomicrobiae bacterium]
MFRNSFVSRAAALSASLCLAAAIPVWSQERRSNPSRIDVEQYNIEAEITPATQMLAAKVTIKFTPIDDGITSANFELNNALNVSRVVDAAGKQIPATRNQSDFTEHLTFDQPLPKGQPVIITFYYDGHLTGQEDSPVYGIKFAAIHPEFGFLLYPSRWFPVSGYSTDRFAADLHIVTPNGYTVLASGIDTHTPGSDKTLHEFHFEHPSFPGSLAIVKEQPNKIASEGVTTNMYFRGAEAEMAQPYGEAVGHMMSYFSGVYGLPPNASLTVVETEEDAPNGYAAPGMIFLAPKAIGSSVSTNLLANQISRQWVEDVVSPTTRNHLWLTNGLATYSEMLWAGNSAGASAMESQAHNVMVDSLTIDNVPIIQSARLEDYSPELWALTGSKGAAVLNMLRSVVGDDKFMAGLKTYIEQFAWKSANTDDFRKIMEAASGKDLGWFFIEWIESSGAPQFTLKYTILREQSKGFRVMGQIAQDLDTFRMPVSLRIETDGNPETKTVEVVGTSSEFEVDTFGKPKNIVIDPNNQVLRISPQMRVAVAIRRGEQYMQLSQFGDAMKEYQKALETNRGSSLAHYRMAEVEFLQQNWQQAANDFREALNGDLDPKWTEVWSHIHLGMIFDVTGQRDRAVNEYNLAIRTHDNTQNAQAEATRYLKTAYERQRRPEQ